MERFAQYRGSAQLGRSDRTLGFPFFSRSSVGVFGTRADSRQRGTCAGSRGIRRAKLPRDEPAHAAPRSAKNPPKIAFHKECRNRLRGKLPPTLPIAGIREGGFSRASSLDSVLRADTTECVTGGVSLVRSHRISLSCLGNRRFPATSYYIPAGGARGPARLARLRLWRVERPCRQRLRRWRNGAKNWRKKRNCCANDWTITGMKPRGFSEMSG